MIDATAKEKYLWRLILYLLGCYHLNNEIVIPFEALEDELQFCHLRYDVDPVNEELCLKAEISPSDYTDTGAIADYRKIWRFV